MCQQLASHFAQEALRFCLSDVARAHGKEKAQYKRRDDIQYADQPNSREGKQRLRPVLPRSREHKNDETRSREALSEWNRSMDVARSPASAPTEFRSGVRSVTFRILRSRP